MNIGITVSPSYPVPPHNGYGGTQRGAYELAMGLAERDHHVFLASTGDSEISHPNVTLVPALSESIYRYGPVGHDAAETLRESCEITTVNAFTELAHAGQLDVVNIRWERPYTVRRLGELGVRNVLSISCNLDQTAVHRLLAASIHETIAITAHTNAHRQALGGHAEIQPAPYGINTDAITPSDKCLSQADQEPNLEILRRLKTAGKDYLLQLATIMPHKGQASAIRIARQAGIPIIIAGTPSAMNPEQGRTYFDTFIAPYIDDTNVLYFGNADEQQKYELMRFAKATLFCSGVEDTRFSEPFGRVIAESLACGTPVIGYRNGAFPELTQEAVTGFGFTDFAEAVKAIGRLDEIDRIACSDYARQNLSTTRFIDHMEDLLSAVVVEKQDVA